MAFAGGAIPGDHELSVLIAVGGDGKLLELSEAAFVFGRPVPRAVGFQQRLAITGDADEVFGARVEALIDNGGA